MVATLPEARFFDVNNSEEIWRRYCSFLDLSMEEFMGIQSYLLLEQVKLVADSPLGKRVMRGRRPTSVEEFRRLVPITRYDEYAACLGARQEDALADKCAFWCHSAGRGGNFKWIPYTRAAFDRIARYVVAGGILAAAETKGAVHLTPHARVLVNLAPRPYASGSLLYYFSQYFPYQSIPPLSEAEDLDFKERTEVAFRLALDQGIDYIFSAASVLTKIGDSFASKEQSLRLGSAMLHPRALLRLARAWTRSRLAGRGMLPRDLWSPKGLITFGVDSALHEEEIARVWGKVPYQAYGNTEMMIGAVQAWNKKAMTFLPDVAFWEFIPQSEWQQSREDPDYQPTTVLMNELQVGKQYELVFSHFYGMPLLRYRIGDVFKVVALEDQETGVKLPQMVFQSRASGIIDLAGLTQIDEKTLSQAIDNAGIRYEEWCARKEYNHSHVYLRLFLELKEERTTEELENMLEVQLRTVDTDYRDLEGWLGLDRTVAVTLLSRGTFASYFEPRMREDAPVAQLRPARMNPSDAAIAQLVQLSDRCHNDK